MVLMKEEFVLQKKDYLLTFSYQMIKGTKI